MTKVRTFMSPLKVFHTVRELETLDEEVNTFIKKNGIDEVISVNDTCTTDASGATIGVIRVVAYREGKSKAKS